MKAANFILRQLNNRDINRDNKDYILKLIALIERDLDSNYGELKKYKKSMEELIDNPKTIRIDDEFLIIKSREHLEAMDETLKKLKRYRQKSIKTIREVYDCYIVLNEIHTSKTVAKEYINQLNRQISLL